MIEKQAGRAIQFDARLLVCGLRRDEIRLSSREGSGILQNRDLGGQSNSQLLLIRIERLPRKIDGRLRCLNGCPILFHIKLRVANLDAHLVLQLVLADLRLPAAAQGRGEL